MPAEIKTRFDFAQELILRAGDFALDYFSRYQQARYPRQRHTGYGQPGRHRNRATYQKRHRRQLPARRLLWRRNRWRGAGSRPRHLGSRPDRRHRQFHLRLALWCVSIAYVVNKQLEFGLVYDPVHQELFSAQRQQGAYLNGNKISTAQATALDQGRVNLGFSTRSQPQQIIPIMASLLAANGVYVNFGSGALGLCHVACGRCIGYYEPHINSWDCYAAALIVQEAGGYITDVTGGDKLRRGCAITACCPGIRSQLEDLIKSC